MLQRHWDRTGEQPTALATMPSVKAHLVAVLDGFNALSRHRPWRDGIPDPIPFTDVRAYAELVGIYATDQVLDFTWLIAECDSEFRQHFAKEAKRKMDEVSAKSKAANKRPR